MDNHSLIGRERERAELGGLLADAQHGRGCLILLAGEAGVGKTRLVEETLAQSGPLMLHGAATQGGTTPYGPLAATFRAYLRMRPGGLSACGSLAGYLALLLPELGPPPREQDDRATLFEAIRCAFAAIAQDQPTAVFLDDLHWADSTTLEVLLPLATWVEHERLLVIGAYRSDEIPRGHPLRRLRTDLRRAGRLHEVALEPLSQEETALLITQILGQPPTPRLATVLYSRTQGVPFYIEELASGLATSGRLRAGRGGIELASAQDMPLPDSVRDAVLLRAEGLSEPARQVLQLASVIGRQFDLDLVAELAGGEEALDEPVHRGLLVETGPGQAAFRHALTREALYSEVPWSRRRALHRQVASALQARGAPPDELAGHWLAAGEFERGREALLASAEAWCRVHAYRDAAHAARHALELWPQGEDEPGRLAVLDRLGQCAELCSELAEAAQAWQEVAEARRRDGSLYQLAEVQRRLATVYELQGAWERALAAHQAAAAAFHAHGLPGEAAGERLAAAGHLEKAGSSEAALELTTVAAAEAAQAERPDLQVVALGLAGKLRTDLGQVEAGLETIRAGLSLALDQNLTGPAAQVYYRLAAALDQASDYTAARAAYQTAITFCQDRGISAMEQFCLACLGVVLHQTGEWDRAVALCRDVLASPESPPPARAIATGVIGFIHALRGQRRSARSLLLGASAQARQYGLALLEMDLTWRLALVDELEGAVQVTADRLRLFRDRWEQTEERHYVVPAFRWAATFFASHQMESDARACAHALAGISSTTGNAEALAALAHALGECALLDGDAQQAALHFDQALETLGRLDLPFWRAQTQVRAAAALAPLGERRAAVERLASAYRAARKLGARPLAMQAAEGLAVLGEPVERRLGRRAAGEVERGGLSRRELEVLRLMGLGRTNREIGHELFLSVRTVGTHVGNILLKLNCASRMEATIRARELRLLPE